jgi:prophage antirepressor-like protein
MPTADEPQLNCGCVFTFPSPIRTPTGGIQEFKVRQETIDGEPWFVAADVCRALGLVSDRGSYSHHLTKLDDTERRVTTRSSIGVTGRGGPISLVSRPGMFKLITRSDKETAKPFQDWVTGEVLPAILDTGGYMLKGVDRQAIACL